MLFKNVAFALLIPVSSMAFAGAPSTEEQSEIISKWGGEVWSSSTVDANGNLDTLSLYISMDTIEGVPDMAREAESVIIPLTETAREQSFFDHISLDWNPHGHEPGPIYGAPHFDIHFYHPSEKEVAAVDCSAAAEIGDDLVVPGFALPPDLSAPGACVPHMGYHASPVTDFAPQFTFGETFIYGYYGGELTFFEPMITKEFFLAGREVSRTLTHPQSFSLIPEALPSSYSVTYDEDANLYKITFSDFSQGQGQGPTTRPVID